MLSCTVSWVGPIITVNFPTVAILNGQFGCVLNFSTHGPHERVWTYKLVRKPPRPLSGRANPVFFELVFDTRIASNSRILCMPRLNLSAYSWCFGWWTILLGYIMTLLNLDPLMVGWVPLENRSLIVLRVGVTT